MSDLAWVTDLVAQRAAGLTLYARQWLNTAEAEDAVQEALTAMLSQRSAPCGSATSCRTRSARSRP